MQGENSSWLKKVLIKELEGFITKYIKENWKFLLFIIIVGIIG